MKASARFLAVLVAAPLSGLSAQGVYYEGGLSLASGNYIFAERTNTFTLLTGLALQAGPVTLRATLPAYFQNTTLLAASSAGLVPTGGSSSGAVADSSASRSGRGGRSGGGGLTPSVNLSSVALLDSLGSVDVPATAVTGYGATVGDPTVGLSAALLRGPRVGVIVSAGAKVPVTDTSSYGTGAWDIGGSVSLSYALGLTTMIGVDVAYWSMGDAPGLELQSSVMTSASISHLALSGWGFSASVFRATPVIDGFSSSASVGVGVLRLAGRGSIGLNAAIGLTETAPDVMVGVSWRLGLGGASR